MSDRYRAVTGNVSVEQARLVLQELALSGWKQQAGFVPPVTEDPPPAPVQHKVGLLPIQETGHPNLSEFNELRLARGLRGRGWLCGSAALSLLIENNTWAANDIDVFAVDKAAYEDIPKRHSEAVAFFDALIADIGQDTEITTERIVEADRHWDNIVSCRELRAIYY